MRLIFKVRHSDDFILLVILKHIRLLDYRHIVLGMADLALQSTPDLGSRTSVHVILNEDDTEQTTRFTAQRQRGGREVLPDPEKEHSLNPPG